MSTYIEHAVLEDEPSGPGANEGPEDDEETHWQDCRVGEPSGEQADQHKEDAECQDVRDSLDEDGAAVREDLAGPDGDRARVVDAQEEVEGILPGAVEEVVLDVPRDGDLAIPHGACLGALAKARHVGLHGASAGVALADHVGVVGPEVAVEELKGRVLVLEGGPTLHQV